MGFAYFCPSPLDGFAVEPDRGVVCNPEGVEVGFKRNGYIFVSSRGQNRKQIRVHRVVWESVHGPIPDGLEINHINGIKTDNRIANLELVTRGENLRHAYRTGLRSYRGEKHPQARLTAKQVADIRLRAKSETQASLAAEFGVAPPHISRIVHNHTWRDAA